MVVFTQGCVQRRRSWKVSPSPNVLTGGAQLLNGPTQYLTLNSVLMSLEYDLYHRSCYSAFMLSSLLCYILISQSLVNGFSSNISVCYRAIKDREAMVAIFKVFWSLLRVKALKLGPKVETGSTPLVVLYVCYGPSCPK